MHRPPPTGVPCARGAAWPGCPGTRLDHRRGAQVAGLLMRALRSLYESASAAFNFTGLFEFNSAWDPVWGERSLV